MAYNRKYDLTITSKRIAFAEGVDTPLILRGPEEAINLKEHQITFSVTKTNKKPANVLNLKVFNLPAHMRDRLRVDSTVALSVGYEDEGISQCFTGFVKNFYTDTSKADTVTTIEAKDGWVNVKEGYSFRSLIPGSTVKQALQQIAILDMGLKGIEFRAEALKKLNEPRETGITLIGHSYTLAVNLCRNINYLCFIEDEKLVIDNIRGGSTEQIIDISDRTGLIGSPQRTNPADNKRLGVPDGDRAVKLKALIRPEVSIGSFISLDSTTIKGIFKVISIAHKGDYEGKSWDTEVTAIDLRPEEL